MGRFDPHVIKRLSRMRRSHIEVGEPFLIDGGNQYMCLAKIMGPKYGDLPSFESIPPPESDDETLCVLSEEGRTADEARQRLLQRIEIARSMPTLPPSNRPRSGWISRIISVFAKTETLDGE